MLMYAARMLTYADVCRKCVLELVEDATVNPLVCSWNDYGTHALDFLLFSSVFFLLFFLAKSKKVTVSKRH